MSGTSGTSGGGPRETTCAAGANEAIHSKAAQLPASSGTSPSSPRAVPRSASASLFPPPWTRCQSLSEDSTEEASLQASLQADLTLLPSLGELLASPSSSQRCSIEEALPLSEQRVRMGRAAHASALHSEHRVRAGQFLRCMSSGFNYYGSTSGSGRESGSGSGVADTLSSTLQAAASCPSPWNLHRGSPESQDANSSLGAPGPTPGSSSYSYSHTSLLQQEPLSLLDYAEQMVLRNSDPSGGGPRAGSAPGCHSDSSASSLIKFAELSLQSRPGLMLGGLLEEEGRRSC